MTKSKHHISSPWVSTSTAAVALGVSPQHLRRLREDNFFKVGRHWKDIARPGAARPTYRWHLKNCQSELDNPSGKRQCP